MAGLFGAAASSTATNTQGDLSKDVEIPQNQTPSDTVSDLAFSPTGDYLAVASWDKKVYIYEVAQAGPVGKWAFEMENSVLCVAWSRVSKPLYIHHHISNANFHVTGRHARSRRRR
jgi:mRNA export factor